MWERPEAEGFSCTGRSWKTNVEPGSSKKDMEA